MKVILITGKQGSGKNRKAYELVGLGKQFIEIPADNLGSKESFEGLSLEHENILIVDEVESVHLHEIKRFKSKEGKIMYRKPYTTEQKEYTVSELYILSRQDISKSFRPGTFMHVKL